MPDTAHGKQSFTFHTNHSVTKGMIQHPSFFLVKIPIDADKTRQA